MRYTIIIRQTTTWGGSSMIALAKKEEGKQPDFQCGVEARMTKGGYASCRVQNVKLGGMYDNAVVDDCINQYAQSKVYKVMIRMNEIIEKVKIRDIELSPNAVEYLQNELQSLPEIGSDENNLLRTMKVLEVLVNIIIGPQHAPGNNGGNIDANSLIKSRY